MGLVYSRCPKYDGQGGEGNGHPRKQATPPPPISKLVPVFVEPSHNFLLVYQFFFRGTR
jgi:hypothetical protein